MPEINLNYELAPRPGMPASQRKAELDGSKFVSVRNLAYMIYKKPDGSPLMTYQETLDNRELVKNNIINTEISLGLLQNDLGNTAVPTSQSPQPIPNGAQMTQPQQQQMPFPQQQPMQPAPMSPQQFAQVPMGAPQPQFAPPQQPMPMAPQPQYQQPQAQPQPQQQQYAAPQPQYAQQPQMQQMPPQMQPMAPMQPMAQAPAASLLETAPVTGKKRKAAAGNAVAPPPGNPVAPPPGFTPAPQAGVPVMQFQQPPAGPPAQPQFQQPQFAPQPQVQQQAPAPQAGGDFGALFQRLDALGKGIEISANNGDQALKAIAKLQGDLDATKMLLGQMLVALHHMYLGMQGANGAPLLAHMTEGKANDLPSFRAFLQKYVGSPQ